MGLPNLICGFPVLGLASCEEFKHGSLRQLGRARAACRVVWEACCQASKLADYLHLTATSSKSISLCKRFRF